MAIITITRGVHSGGKRLAHLLEERLGYQCLSREVVETCARKYNIPEQELYETLIEAPSRWRGPSKEHVRYPLYTQCALIDAAKQDNVIYHGYAGQLFLRGVTHSLKIRLETPFRDRVAAEMNEHNISREEAEKNIEKADGVRARWVKLLYDESWYDPALYDLCISLNKMSLDSVSEMVVFLVEQPEFRTTEKSIQRLNELSLECEVKAAIASDDNLWSYLWDKAIAVTAEDSVITLRGTVKKKEIAEAVQEVASKVKGVSECRLELHSLTDLLSERPSYGGG
jgi:cytidylate kinase